MCGYLPFVDMDLSHFLLDGYSLFFEMLRILRKQAVDDLVYILNQVVWLKENLNCIFKKMGNLGCLGGPVG